MQQTSTKKKTKDNCVERKIHRELCKSFRFDHITKWYIRKLEFVLDNETHKILCDFEIQTDHLITVRRPDLVLINKKKKKKKKKGMENTRTLS